jgi:mitogen-activated protein kinase 15
MPINQAINSKYAAIMIESIPHGTISYKHINEVFPTASPDAIDIMRCCLLFNPDSRPFAHDILKHAYCVDFHNESDEPDYPFGQLILPLDDNLVYTCDEYRDCLYKEMTERRREVKPALYKIDLYVQDSDLDIHVLFPNVYYIITS